MRCDVAREALSARIDGERETVPSARVDEHLAGCAQCTAWFDAVQSLHIPQIREPMRVVGDDGPDLVAMMMAVGDTAAPANRDPDRAARIWWILASVGAFGSGALAVATVATGGHVVLLWTFVAVLAVTVALTGRARRR